MLHTAVTGQTKEEGHNGKQNNRQQKAFTISVAMRSCPSSRPWNMLNIVGSPSTTQRLSLKLYPFFLLPTRLASSQVTVILSSIINHPCPVWEVDLLLLFTSIVLDHDL